MIFLKGELNMEKKSWIGIILAAVLGIFGIGVGVKKHNQKKNERIAEEERKQRKRNREIAEIQRNQMELAKTQRQTVEILKQMRDEIGMDPTTIDLDLKTEDED